MSDAPARREASRYRWRDLEADHPMPLIERRRVHGDQMTVAHVQLRKGFKIEPHAHYEEQIALVIAGKLRFVLGEPPNQREVFVEADECVLLPSNVHHGAEALEDSLVLDLFSPPARESGLDRAGR
jgi:quercetin dioxygenase-like cupin family protein